MKDSDWEILYRLYKTPNITKVANMLYISQPSLTRKNKCISEPYDTGQGFPDSFGEKSNRDRTSSFRSAI